MRYWAAILVIAGLAAGVSSQASAACTTFNSANGLSTYPGTYAGSVGGAGTLCQIGAVDPPAGSTSAALVNSAVDPSNYEFFYDGGALTVTETIGGDSFGAIGFELDSWSGSPTRQTSTPGTSLQLVPGSSQQLPGNASGPDGPITLVSNDSLAAGY
jgi:hypothetical protein